MREAQWDFFYYYFLKVAVTLPSFTANQMLETSAQMVSFHAFFSVLETGFVHQILICSPCFCGFYLCSLQFPSSTGIQVPSQDIFFLTCLSPEEKEIVLPSSTFPNNTVLDDPKKQTTGNSNFYKSCDPRVEEGSHILTTSRPRGLKAIGIKDRANQTLFCCHQLPPVMLPSWPSEGGILLPESVHHSHVPLCCLSPCAAAIVSFLCFLMLCSDCCWTCRQYFFFVEQTCPLTMEGEGRLPFNHNYSVASVLPTTARVLQSLLAHWGLKCSLRC